MAITNQVIQLPGDSTGKKLDTSELTVGANTVNRERMNVADPEDDTGIATVTSSGGLSVHVTNPSTAVTVSNISTAVTVTNISTAVTITNPSTAVSLSSTPTFNLVGTSSGIAPVTTSGGLGVTILAGSGSGSTEVSLSSAIAISSGTVTLSSAHTVTATAATNPWSSAPSFNVPILSASSGRVGTFPSTSLTYSVFTFNSSSSNSITNVTTAAAVLYGWNVGNQGTSASASIKLFNSTTATVGSTTNLQNTIPLPGGSAGGGNNHMLQQGVAYSGGITIAMSANFAATSTGVVAAGDVVGTLYFI